MSPSPSRRLWTRLLIGILLLAGWVVFWRTVVEPAGDPDVFSIPARGQARAEFLADGTPVWVVHHEDGSFTVVEALSPHTPHGISVLIGWCASGRGFSDPRGGGWFNEYGQHLLGPPPHGLSRRGFEILAGDPPVLRIGHALAPEPRGGADTPVVGFGHRPCTYTSPEFTPEFHRVPLSDLSPAEVLAVGPDGRVALRGVLVLKSEDAAMLCSFGSAAGECLEGAPVEGVEADADATIPGVWLVEAGQGALARLISGPDVRALAQPSR